MRNIVGLRQRISFYETIVKQRSDAVLVAGKDKKITICSSGAESLFGCVAKKVEGKNLFDFLSAFDDAVFWEIVKKRLFSGEAKISERRVFSREGGGTVPLLFSLEVVCDEDCFQGAIFVGKDVSHEVELEAENKRIIAKLEQENRTDPVTRIPNRRAFDERINDEVERAKRFHRSLSLLFIDIDDFKARVNTPHGHTIGDRVLQAAASVFGSNTRETDLLARYAGDEFAVILPETEKNGAMILAEKIRSAMEKAPIILRDSGQRLVVTVSIGVASFIQGGTVEGLVRKASRAALQAKAHGRNQVWDADRRSGHGTFMI
jgi:diguanylate cyclase (GGDEF)-like protein/PAS domain S-box-containing protein